MFFFHHPKTLQAIKLEPSNFKDTSLRNILQVMTVRYTLSCYHGNKITKGTSQNLTQWRSDISEQFSHFFKDIELKFGMETNFGPLNSKSNIKLEFYFIMTS